MKRLLAAFFILAIIMISAVLARNIIIEAVIEKTISAAGGLELSIGRLDIGFLKTTVDIEDLQLLNPDWCPERIMFNIPQIYVDYDIRSLFTDHIRINRMVFYLKELNVIKGGDGVLNLNSLNMIKTKGAGPQKGAMPSVSIKHLRLKGGKALYKDYSQTPPKSVLFVVNIDEEYTDIDDPYELGCLIVSRTLRKTAIARLADLNLDAIEERVGAIINRGAGIIGGGTDVMKRTSGQIVGASKGIAGQAGETLSKIRDTVGGLLSAPDGEEKER